jgi:hypothetical protein
MRRAARVGKAAASAELEVSECNSPVLLLHSAMKAAGRKTCRFCVYLFVSLMVRAQHHMFVNECGLKFRSPWFCAFLMEAG